MIYVKNQKGIYPFAVYTTQQKNKLKVMQNVLNNREEIRRGFDS